MSIDVARINQTLFQVEAALNRNIDLLRGATAELNDKMNDIRPAQLRNAVVNINNSLNDIKESLAVNNANQAATIVLLNQILTALTTEEPPTS